MTDNLKFYTERLESLAQQKGLDYFPVDFVVVPTSFMMEVAVYGLPVRMPHWSFGVRYIHQLVQHRMGHSHLFEVVFPGNPGRAFMADTNSVAENTLVTAHVLGHADFSKNNLLFRKSQEQVGYHIVEQAAANAHHISKALDIHGQARVEKVLDAALALEQHIDPQMDLHRPLYPIYQQTVKEQVTDPFQRRFNELTVDSDTVIAPKSSSRAPLPPYPEHDLLWFIANYAPELDDWERDIFLAVRQESFYFHPVFACQIMNEGWACLWHTTLLREADFLPNDLFLDSMKSHSDVVRPYAGDEQISLKLNPYHIGFSIWSDIVEREGIDKAREIMREDDDFGFIRNYLTEELADELNLFQYKKVRRGKYRVVERDLNTLKEIIVANKFNFGAPHIYVESVNNDGTLVLVHDHQIDGRGLDLKKAEKVVNYIYDVWRRPVELTTIDEKATVLKCSAPLPSDL